jgi:hypothetical protein
MIALMILIALNIIKILKAIKAIKIINILKSAMGNLRSDTPRRKRRPGEGSLHTNRPRLGRV